MTAIDRAIRDAVAAAESARVKQLRQRVRTLERQRDQAHARCAELRQHVARYQSELAAARSRPTAKTNP